MIINFANRAHNHNFEADWVVRSLLDTDFYKLLMQQFIWKNFPEVPVAFSSINRTSSVKLAEVIDEAELRRQLDHVRTLRFAKSELIWLAGNTFYGHRGIFAPEFFEWLADFRLPEYELKREGDQWVLRFPNDWMHSTMWEIPALSIISELRTRAGLATMNEFELDIFYARGKAKLWEKIERLRGIPGIKFADFGTRRRHSFLWQEYVVQAMAAELPDAFTGTSNAYLAMKHDQEAVGTNAHELPMVLAALAVLGRSTVGLKMSQFEVLKLWQETYGGALLVMLADTFGTTQFLAEAPGWIDTWTGMRVDSKDPYVAGEEYIAWLEARGQDPRAKLLVFSDGLDVDDIIRLYAQFGGRIRPGYSVQDFKRAADFLDSSKWVHEPRIRVGFGWGTLQTNDFRGCHPRGLRVFEPISLVCKVEEVFGQPAVKLSDNYEKATGPADEVKRYRAVFGTAGVANVPLLV
jgi:nicotinate phosphoribosyltransferase